MLEFKDPRSLRTAVIRYSVNQSEINTVLDARPILLCLPRLSSFILMVRGSHSKPMSRLREETDRLRAILLDCVAANEGEILYRNRALKF